MIEKTVDQTFIHSLSSTIFNRKRRVELGGLVLFSILTIWMLVHHEPWADEAQAWLIASSYQNPVAMLSQAGYEGSPMLWHLVLWVLSHLGLGIWSMQVFHIICAITSAFLILWYAPFERYQRILAVFGYYFVFEYNTIARSYAITVLLLAYLGTFYENRYDKQLRFGIILGLIAQTNIHGLIFSLVIYGVSVLEKLVQDREVLNFIRNYSRTYIPFMISVVIAIIILLPPDDIPQLLGDWDSIRTHDPIGYGLFFTMRGFFPMQTIDHLFWSYDLRVAMFGYTEAKIAAILILVTIFVQFARKGYPLLLVFPTLIGYNILFVYKRGICPRHCGLIYIVYFFVYWYSMYYSKLSLDPIRDKFTSIVSSNAEDTMALDNRSVFTQMSRKFSKNNLGSKLFSVFLIIQLLSMPIPVYHDTVSPFSNAENVGNYLRTHNYTGNGILFAAHQWFPTLAVIPHLPDGYDKLYYIEQEQFGTYVTWDEQFFNSQALSPGQVIDRSLDEYHLGNYSRLVLILNYEMIDSSFYDIFVSVKYFEGAIIGQENFYLYTLI